MMRECLAVAAGGAVGSLARYGLLLLFSLLGAAWLPIATLLANVLGCLAIGYLAHWSLQIDSTQQWWVVGARVGLLGGLTTFSSFALDVFRVWEQDRPAGAVLLASAHLALGLVAVVTGLWLARQ